MHRQLYVPPILRPTDRAPGSGTEWDISGDHSLRQHNWKTATGFCSSSLKIPELPPGGRCMGMGAPWGAASRCELLGNFVSEHRLGVGVGMVLWSMSGGACRTQVKDAPNTTAPAPGDGPARLSHGDSASYRTQVSGDQRRGYRHRSPTRLFC